MDLRPRDCDPSWIEDHAPRRLQSNQYFNTALQGGCVATPGFLLRGDRWGSSPPQTAQLLTQTNSTPPPPHTHTELLLRERVPTTAWLLMYYLVLMHFFLKIKLLRLQYILRWGLVLRVGGHAPSPLPWPYNHAIPPKMIKP
jgi:hypothetical protein